MAIPLLLEYCNQRLQYFRPVIIVNLHKMPTRRSGSVSWLIQLLQALTLLFLWCLHQTPTPFQTWPNIVYTDYPKPLYQTVGNGMNFHIRLSEWSQLGG
jgi:hypothetical protein